MNITTILCTYNRCQSLAKALDSLAASALPESVEWEVLVVDNNSSDGTKAVVEEFCQQHPGRFRYLSEPQQGKSYALNSGIRNSRGEILAFVDDDVTVESDWLQNLTSPLRDGQWAGSGGRILPMHGLVPPHWLALEGPLSLVGALCAYCNPGEEPGELKHPPYGANMAFRREMFDKYGYFRIDLGPRPNSELRSEDTEFGRRLFAGGERLRYVPSAVVYHEIHENRVKKEYFLVWWFDFGRSSIREAGKIPGAWTILKMLGRVVMACPQWLLTADPKVRFYRKCRIWFDAGKIAETYQRANLATSAVHKVEPRQASRESDR